MLPARRRPRGYTFSQIIIGIIVILGLIAVLYVAVHELQIPIPPFVVTLFWIVLLVVAAIFAVKLIVGAANKGGGPPSIT
jgi:hypothetical protein